MKALSLAYLIGGGIMGWLVVGLLQSDRVDSAPLSENAHEQIEEFRNSTSDPVSGERSLDLSGAIREIESRSTPIEQVVATLVLSKELPESDIQRTLEATHLFPDHSASSILEQLLLSRWMTCAPEEAMRWSLTNDVRSYNLAKEWASRDPESVKRFADTLHSDNDYKTVYSAMATTLAENNFQEAVDFIRENPGGGIYSNALRNLAGSDPEGLRAQLDQFPPNHYAYSALAENWPAHEPEAAFEWALSLNRPDLMRRVVGNIKELDKTLNLIARLPPDDQAKTAGWVRNLHHIDDLDRARDLVAEAGGLSDGARASLQSIIDNEIENRAERSAPPSAPTPPRDPTGLALALAGGEYIRDEVIRADWSREELVEAIEALPESTRFKAHYDHFRIVQSGGHYTECTELLPYLPPEDPKTLEAVSNLAVQWTRRSPAVATKWIEGLPASSTKDWAAANASRQWARINPVAAETWLQGLVTRGEVNQVLTD